MYIYHVDVCWPLPFWRRRCKHWHICRTRQYIDKCWPSHCLCCIYWTHEKHTHTHRETDKHTIPLCVCVCVCVCVGERLSPHPIMCMPLCVSVCVGARLYANACMCMPLLVCADVCVGARLYAFVCVCVALCVLARTYLRVNALSMHAMRSYFDLVVGLTCDILPRVPRLCIYKLQ